MKLSILISESKLIKTSGDVEIYEHPAQGKFAVLEGGQISFDEEPIRATIESAGTGPKIDTAQPYTPAQVLANLREFVLPALPSGAVGDAGHHARWVVRDILARGIAEEGRDGLLLALRELCADKYLSDPINAARMANARAAIAQAEGQNQAPGQ